MSAVVPQETVVAGSRPAGLTSAEARRRLAEVGPNAVAEEAPSALAALFEKFWGLIAARITWRVYKSVSARRAKIRKARVPTQPGQAALGAVQEIYACWRPIPTRTGAGSTWRRSTNTSSIWTR
jgi:hypothetical protein